LNNHIYEKIIYLIWDDIMQSTIQPPFIVIWKVIKQR